MNHKYVRKICAVIFSAMILSMTMLSLGCGETETESEALFQIEKITESTVYTKSTQRQAQTVYTLSFDYLGGSDVMPLGTFFGPYTPVTGMENGYAFGDYCTDYYFTGMVDVGINMINLTSNQWREHKASIQNCLELCKKYNIGYIMNDFGLTEDYENMDATISEYINEECVLGNFLRDEPFEVDFDNIKTIYEKYTQATDKMLYVNLFPSYQSNLTKTSEVITWEEYLTRFLQHSDSKCLSYDYYPFDRPNRGSKNMGKYYSGLITARKVSNSFELPFWCYIQCGNIWDNTVGASTPVLYPSEGEFLWNVNSCLAFGAKSLVYHTFIQPPYMSTTEDSYDFDSMGLFGADGSINRWYYYAKKANQEIKAIDHILMNASNLGVIAVGEDLNNNIEQSIKTENGAFRELKSVKGDYDNVLVGCFDYQGRTMLYIVNCETTNKQKITLEFDNKYGYEVIQRGISEKVAGEGLNLTLETGEGVLVTLL